VASTGIHGANRLASNSLLEALVYARRVAAEIRHDRHVASTSFLETPATPIIPGGSAVVARNAAVNNVRDLMSRYVGILRSGAELEHAHAALADIERGLPCTGEAGEEVASTFSVVRSCGEARNLILVARLVTLAALRREESRGAHYRDDYPQPRSEWHRQQSMTATALFEAH
jgi:L-aspartate oxidase